jgi:hypothetical protein
MSAPLARVLALTDDMLDAAYASDFDRVATLDDERRRLLAAGFGTEPRDASLVATLVERDRALVAIVAEARRHAGEQLRNARLAQAGAGAYLALAR